jgi:hypothetical protein
MSAAPAGKDSSPQLQASAHAQQRLVDAIPCLLSPVAPAGAFCAGGLLSVNSPCGPAPGESDADGSRRRIQPEVREGLLDHRLFQDGGDDLQLTAAVRAAVHVEVKDALELSGQAQRLALSRTALRQYPLVAGTARSPSGQEADRRRRCCVLLP